MAASVFSHELKLPNHSLQWSHDTTTLHVHLVQQTVTLFYTSAVVTDVAKGLHNVRVPVYLSHSPVNYLFQSFPNF